MRYLPLTDDDRRGMLAAIGVPSVDALYSDVPRKVLLDGPVDLPGFKSELEVERHIGALAAKNLGAASCPSFLGAGAYRHHIPAAVDHLIQRGEFLTSYTPYQPEVTQGTLQYLFEFQTQVALLTGMDVANASMYDGATATAEAVMMANRVTRRRRAVLSGGLHPHYRETIETHGRFTGFEVTSAPADANGAEDLAKQIDGNTSCVVVQNPSFFGHVHDLSTLAKACHDAGALLVVAVTEIVSLGLSTPPSPVGRAIGLTIILVAVAAIAWACFGKRQGHLRGLAAHQRRFVGGRHHDDAARQAFRAELVLDEFLHLAAALADQADDVDVERGIARHHRQQHRLADAGGGKDAHALPTTAGREGVDGADAEIDLFAHPSSGMRRRRNVADAHRVLACGQRPLAVDRFAERVDDAPQPGAAWPHHRIGFDHNGFATQPDAFQRAEGERQRASVPEPDDLATDPSIGAVEQIAARADRKRALDAGDLHQHSKNRRHAAIHASVGDSVDVLQDVFDRQRVRHAPSRPEMLLALRRV